MLFIGTDKTALTSLFTAFTALLPAFRLALWFNARYRLSTSTLVRGSTPLAVKFLLLLSFTFYPPFAR